MKTRLLGCAAALCLLATMAHAGGTSGVNGTTDVTPVPFSTFLGFQQFSVSGSAVGFTPPTGSAVCYIEAETQAVRYRTDGVNPTASVGSPIPATTSSSISQIALSVNIAGTRFISQTGTATVDADCYR